MNFFQLTFGLAAQNNLRGRAFSNFFFSCKQFLEKFLCDFFPHVFERPKFKVNWNKR